jgi:hypothetical protein
MCWIITCKRCEIKGKGVYRHHLYTTTHLYDNRDFDMKQAVKHVLDNTKDDITYLSITATDFLESKHGPPEGD